MVPSEIKQLLDEWPLGDAKVFKLRYDFAQPDILVILKEKEDLYIVDCFKSTVKHNSFTKDELLKNLNSGKIVHLPGNSTIVNYGNIKTGGCTCGAWSTTEPNCHSYWCSKSEV